MRSVPEAVTTPMSATSSSQRAQTFATASGWSVTQTIRSWLSEITISTGSMSASRSGTRSRWTSRPTPPLAISEREDARPAAPRSCSDWTRPPSTSARLASISFLPVKGSPTWTEGRLSSSSSESSWLASTLAPPIPSRPVVAPKRTTWLPAPARLGARHAVGREEPDAHRVDERVRRVGVVEDRVAADGGDADAVAVVADAADRAAELEPGLAEAQAVEERDRDARPWRRCRGGSRRPPSPRPGRARPRTDGCGSRP